MGSLRLVAIVLLLGSPAFAQSSPTYGVGRTPTTDEIRALDISIAPTGEELPPGRGTAKEGVEVFEEEGCVGCHGEAGIGGLAPALKSKRAKMFPSGNASAYYHCARRLRLFFVTQ
jgi:S-disulfanyl-L-cysteine oxidoreductase SoxD